MSAILSKADEEELRLSYDLFHSDRCLTKEEKRVLYDPTKDQIPTLAQVRKRLKNYQSPFSKPPKLLTDIIPLSSTEVHEQSLSALNSVDELHAKAKEMADLAFIAGKENHKEKSKLLYKHAFDYERKAAMLAQAGEIEFTPAELFESAADLALDAEAYQEAEQMIELGLSAESLVIEETEKLLGLLDYLADIYYENGDYDKAQPLLEKALEIREKILGAEDPQVATSLNQLGLFYQEKAKRLFEKALAIVNRSYPRWNSRLP
jgi:tetratricopeptide (TPR) repeat protein